jgi:hypothetical protein
MNLDTLTTAELYTEIADLARAQGIATQDMWNQLCDETLESHEDLAELNDDQDLEQKRLALHEMYEEYTNESGPESLNAISEDPEAPHE